MSSKAINYALGGVFLFATLATVLAAATYIAGQQMRPWRIYQSVEEYDQSVSSAPAIVEPVKNITSIVFGGDVMLARNVQVQQAKVNDYTRAWSGLAEVFRSADLALINLESPFSSQPPYPTAGFVFRARPENIAGLQFAGIDIVNLANNHFNNAGPAGMNYTFTILSEHNIKYIGAGTSTVAAYQGLLVDLPAVKLGFVAQGYNAGSAATVAAPGIAVFDLDKLATEIKNLRSAGADLVFVQYHGGIEYVRRPNQEQIDFARAAVAAGADLVVMHHPHWIQDLEIYQGKYIFYSLGNLIFDQNWSVPTTQGIVLRVTLQHRSLSNIEILPVVIEENFRPRLAGAEEISDILAGTNITATEIFLD